MNTIAKMVTANRIKEVYNGGDDDEDDDEVDDDDDDEELILLMVEALRNSCGLLQLRDDIENDG